MNDFFRNNPKLATAILYLSILSVIVLGIYTNNLSHKLYEYKKDLSKVQKYNDLAFSQLSAHIAELTNDISDNRDFKTIYLLLYAVNEAHMVRTIFKNMPYKSLFCHFENALGQMQGLAFREMDCDTGITEEEKQLWKVLGKKVKEFAYTLGPDADNEKLGIIADELLSIVEELREKQRPRIK